MQMNANDTNNTNTQYVFNVWQKCLDFYKNSKNKQYLPLILVCIFLIYFAFIKAPLNFPVKTLIHIEKGSTLEEVSTQLKQDQIINSEFFFKIFAILFEGDTGARWGDYYFEKPQTVFTVAKRITGGLFGLTPVKVTFPEGLSVFEIAQISEDIFKNINKEEFVDLAQGKEGYLFPDTYLFLPNVSSQQVIEAMLDNFYNKTENLNGFLGATEARLRDVIIMASIIEEEAITPEDKKIVSGILWKRIEIGMPLQVDAVFLYINGKSTFDLTLDDLQIDSPYNTYKYGGLPPTPISNPGLESIIAALDPEESPYLYYLSDLESEIHYAETFIEHKRNKQLYLK